MGRTDRASIVIRAARERIYAALLDPSALETWLPPDNMKGRVLEFDARPGGVFRMELTYLDGNQGKSSDHSDVTEVTFIELVPGERIVQRVVFDSDDPQFAGAMTMTWSLLETGDGTRVEIRADDVPPGISSEDHATGLTASLNNLASYLAAP
ncbi:MAG: SRPBCC family protein [Actinobacteria bacterium]|nr:SRPBCC family protein [Actinomycetota bacterium]